MAYPKSQIKAISREVAELLASGPANRADLFARALQASDVEQVSRALNVLKNDGLAERNSNGIWSLTSLGKEQIAAPIAPEETHDRPDAIERPALYQCPDIIAMIRALPTPQQSLISRPRQRAATLRELADYPPLAGPIAEELRSLASDLDRIAEEQGEP